MFSIFFFAVTALIAGIIAIVTLLDGSIDDNRISNIVSTISITYTTVMLMFLIIGCARLNHTPWQEGEMCSTQSIVALNDGVLMQKHGYVRRSYIEQDLYYIYLMQRPDGGYESGKVKADNAVLYYTDSNFRIEEYRLRRHWFILGEKSSLYKIYIPKDSIVEDYAIDLE